MPKIEVRLGEERLVTPGGLSTVGMLIEKTNLFEELDKVVATKKGGSVEIQNSDVVGAMVAINCQGKNDYENVNEFKDEKEVICDMLGIKKIPSPEILRQRLDFISKSILTIILNAIVDLLIKTNIKLTPCFGKHVPLDIDVTPFDNSKTQKEGVSWTYKKFDGYAPITAALGIEGYIVGAELRPRSQHSQKGTPEFLSQTIKSSKKITNAPLLVRMDSGFDCKENIIVCRKEDTKADFIIKRNLGTRHETLEQWKNLVLENIKLKEENPDNEINMSKVPNTRVGKDAYIGNEYHCIAGVKEPVRIVYEVIFRNSKADGQILLEPDVEVNTFWVSLGESEEAGMTASEVLQQYKAHATSEQFHAELKTDMGLERFPSKYLNTNKALFLISIFAYNILRVIGQESLKSDDAPLKRPVQRRRIRTVIQNLITIAVRAVSHSRKTILSLGRSNAWRHTFIRVHSAFA